MLLLFIFLVVFGFCIYYVINLLVKKRLTENFADYRDDRTLGIYDSHHFLMTSIQPGKEDIVKLKEHNPHHTNFFYVDPTAVITERTDPMVVTHRPSVLDKTQPVTCIGSNDPIRQIIKTYQPYFYDHAEILNYYDHPFYRDWRYPERPIDPKFATNPEKYCDLNPQVYPCYKYYSKW
jgi:hypothetical protein